MVSPGAGAGAQTAATAQIRSCMQNIQVAALSFQPGTREFNGVMRALNALNSVFGKTGESDLDPAARARMAQPAPSPLAGMAPPGMAGAGPGGPPAPTPGPSPGDQGGGNPAFP
jgi:hypothetical protein